MAHQSTAEDANLTVVAVDNDENSHCAVKWAIANLLIFNPKLTLVHFANKSTNNQTNCVTPDANCSTLDEDPQQIFGPFRGYCEEKEIIPKEVVLEGTDVHNAILSYINNNLVANVVVGTSSSSLLSRNSWPYDVPTTLIKSAADFCSVYIIEEDMVRSSRPRARSPPTSSTPRSSSPFRPNDFDTEDEARTRYSGEGKLTAALESPRPRTSLGNTTATLGGRRERNPSSHKSISGCEDLSIRQEDFSIRPTFGSVDFSAQHLDFNFGLENTQGSNHRRISEAEAETRRLKLELKQTMSLYNSARQELDSAKKKAEEIRKWQMEEARRFEQARVSEEAALAMVEMEKLKSKTAIEAAKKAQKLAEIEATRRKLAESKARREEAAKNRALNVLSQNDVLYRKYTIQEIETATNHFSRSLKIGEGGYGPVFKGKLDHTPVAIKVLRPDAAQGKKQFQQEVEVLSCIRHPNMVLLLGACPEYGCLVYEFMNYGSLEDRLFRKGNTPSIPWKVRFKIAAEIATALLFLHQTKPEPLVHRDLKPANILLNRHYDCKISDVGLSRLVPASVADSVTQYHLTSAAGTLCYIDPEYQRTGKLGTKSDIYSLGVMLLQIITARSPMRLSHQVEDAIQKGTFPDILDQTVPDWPVEEALNFAKLALNCVQLRKKDRPDLDSVVVPELTRLKRLGRVNNGRQSRT